MTEAAQVKMEIRMRRDVRADPPPGCCAAVQGNKERRENRSHTEQTFNLYCYTLIKYRIIQCYPGTSLLLLLHHSNLQTIIISCVVIFYPNSFSKWGIMSRRGLYMKRYMKLLCDNVHCYKCYTNKTELH